MNSVEESTVKVACSSILFFMRVHTMRTVRSTIQGNQGAGGVPFNGGPHCTSDQNGATARTQPREQNSLLGWTQSCGVSQRVHIVSFVVLCVHVIAELVKLC